MHTTRCPSRDAAAAFAVLSLLLAVPLAASAQEVPIVLRGVHVIPMDTERVLPAQSVVVQAGRITDMGPADQVAVPQGAQVIDAEGLYLIPGLADMHVHFRMQEELDLFLVNGVTTVRVMWGWTQMVEWRNSIADGGLLGPTMYVAGPILEGTPPAEYADVIATQGRIIVDTRKAAQFEAFRQKLRGYDFLKVYNNVNEEAYAGIVEQGRAVDLAVAGHVPFSVGLEGVFEAGQRSIEHLRGYVWEVVPQAAPIQPGPDLRSRSLAWQFADTTRFRALAERTREAGVWNTPTLSTRLFFLTQEEIEELLAGPEGQFLTEAQRAGLRDRSSIQWLSSFSPSDFQAVAEGLKRQETLVLALHRAGAGLLAGTDVQPVGFGLHGELELFVRAGLSPYEALKTATVNPALFLEWEDAGTIAVGKRADLVLLEGDPLRDIRNTRRIAGIMVHGRWISAEERVRMLERLRNR